MKSIYLIFLVFFLLSCKQEKKRLYEFNPKSLKQNEITLSKIADEISYVPLDNSVTLGEIYNGIRFTTNSIYLSERNNGVLSFNRAGKISRKIGSKGRGPGEYVYNTIYTVDENTETVYVRDASDIIKIYSKSGKYLRSFSLREYGESIDAINIYNSNLLASFQIQNENNKYKWVIIDSIGNLIKKEKRKTPAFSSRVAGPGGTYIYLKKMSYWNTLYTDTVFSILPDLTEEPAIIINPGEYRFPKSMIMIPPTELEKYFAINLILEADGFWTIQYSISKKRYFAFIDKKDKKTFISNWEFDGRGGIPNDLDGGTSFLPKNYFVENGREYMAGLINPLQIKSLVTSNEFKNSAPKNPEKKKELEKLANILKETDNPILMMVRLKK
jgi:hypothetical protein